MSDAGTIFAVGMGLGILVLLSVPVWRALAGQPSWVKGLLAIACIVLVAGALTASLIGGSAPDRSVTQAQAPEKASPPKKAEPPASARAPSDNDGMSGEPTVGSAEPEGEARAPTPFDTESMGDDLKPGSPAPPEESHEATRSLGGGGGGAAPPAPPPAPVTAAPKPDAPQGEWDVVPVYYGTDRARADQTERADYGNERGRRLELGQALVTVPRSHTVPQIERPWSIHIPYFDITIGESEDPNTHFTMKDVTPLTRDEFLTRVRARLEASQRYKKHALIFVHGFNTTFDFAIYRTAQIAYDLKFDGAPFSYSWPSGGGLASYTFDRERSEQSVKFLKEYIELVLDKTGAEAVSVVAHSMGNQPMLQVLKDLKAARPSGVVFNQIILAAPDVDRDSFGDIANELQGLAKNITLYAAENDTALAVSRSVNGAPRAGDIPVSGPLVMPGVDTLDVTSVSTDSLGINHSGYAENNKLLKDIELLVSTGARPKDRQPTLEIVKLGDGTYWRFPK